MVTHCIQSSHELINAVFISVPVFLISSFSFWIFLRVSISLLTYINYPFMLSIFSIRIINILVKIILNISDNFNIYIMSESGSDVCFVSTELCFFLGFSISCNFLLKVSMTLGKAFCVRFYANLIRNQAVFYVCCSHQCQVFKCHHILVVVHPVYFGFPKCSSSERVSVF